MLLIKVSSLSTHTASTAIRVVKELVNFFRNVKYVAAHKIHVEITMRLSRSSFDHFQFEQD